MFLNKRWYRVWALYSLWCVLLAPYLVHEVYANDLWKSLYFGRYVAQFGAFPTHAQFAFTPTVAPVSSDVYSWFGHVVIYGLYELGSVPGLVVVRVFLVLASLGLLHAMADFRSNRYLLLILVLWGIGLSQKTLVRTALFAIPAVTLFWWCYDSARRHGSRWLWLGWPILFVFWGNLHGSYLYGIGLVGLLAVGQLIDGWRFTDPLIDVSGWEWMGLLSVILVIVVFFKPYPDVKIFQTLQYGLRFPARALEFFETGSGTGGIQGLRSLLYQGSGYEGDMRSIAGRGLTLSFWYVPYVTVSLFLGLATLLIRVFRKPRRFSLLLPLVATLAMGCLYLRFVALVPLTAVPVLLITLEPEGWERGWKHRSARWLVGLVLVIMAVPWWYLSQGEMARVMHNRQFQTGWTKSANFSEAVPEYILSTYPNRKVFTHYDIGGYLIWRWWSRKKVFIDSKNWAYERPFRNRYLRSSPGELMERYDLELAVFPLSSAWNYYLFIPSPRWQLLRFDQGMALYGSRGQFAPPDRRLLLKRRKVDRLDKVDRTRLERFRQFVDTHGNNPKHVGIFTHPE